MYISPVDILGISVDELMNLDSRGLIRLEKRLKIQKLQQQDDAYNPQQYDALLAQLADVEKKKSIFFVEKHPNLKKFISTGEDDGVKTFSIDENLLKDAPHVNQFLAPYFDAYFMRLVKRDFKNRNYDALIRAMKYKALFTNQLLTTYYEYIKTQIEIITEKIVVAKKGQLIEYCPEITYKTLVELMNTVPLGFIKKVKLGYVNAMVDYYNSTLNNYPEFSKVKRVFSNFPFIEIGDQDLIAYFKQLSQHITTTSVKRSPQSESSSSSGWQVIFIVIGIIIFIARFSRLFTGSSSNSSSRPTSSFNFPVHATTYDENKTAFYSDLIRKASGDSITTGNERKLQTGSNPYPLQFKNMKRNNRSKTSEILIENKRANPVIVFMQANPVIRENKAVAILGGDSLRISGISKKSMLVFYAGKAFVNQQNGITIDSKSGNFKIKPPKGYFRSVSENELAWLKDKNLIDSVGNEPKIILTEDELVFNDIQVHQEAHEILPLEPAVVENTIESGKKWNISKNHFFSDLEKGATKGTRAIPLANGTNPYPVLFKDINHPTISGYEVPVYNNSKEGVIVFSRNVLLARDQAVFVASKDSIQIHLHDANDTLYFYKGRDFRKVESTYTAINAPHAYFMKFSKENKKLFKHYYAVQELGDNPQITLSDTDVIFTEVILK